MTQLDTRRADVPGVPTDPESGRPVIEFFCDNFPRSVFPNPAPAREFLPSWYKKMETYPEQQSGMKAASVKGCSPFFDSLAAGYIIPIPQAITVRANEDGIVNFDWMTSVTAVEAHANRQMEGSTFNPPAFFKFINHWVIKTPPGYSCLFIPPVNREPQPYTLFSGIVETDTYETNINFPFHWNKFPFDDVIEDGVPMVQVIPFKREDWDGRFRDSTDEEEMNRQKESERTRAQWRYYRKNHRKKKVWGLRRNA